MSPHSAAKIRANCKPSGGYGGSERLKEVRAAIERGILEVLTAAELREIGLACVNHAIIAGQAMMYANAAVLTALGVIAGEEIVAPMAQGL